MFNKNKKSKKKAVRSTANSSNDSSKKINKKPQVEERVNSAIPINYRCLTWTWEQWLATITFIGWFILNHGNIYYDFRGKQLPITLFTIIALGAICFAQSYVYGCYFTNTFKDIVVPIVIVVGCLAVECMFALVLKKMQVFVFWGYVVKCYGTLLLQGLILFFVFKRVEHVEISVEMYEDLIN